MAAMLLLKLAVFISATLAPAAALSQPAAGGSKTQSSSVAAAAPGQILSIAGIPGCSSNGNSRALMPELSSCSWSVQMRRGSVRWYAFEVPHEAAENMSVVFMARATSGQITLALWAPGSDPYRSPPSQTGVNHLEQSGVHTPGQEAAAGGGGHRNIASEQQYLFLERKDTPLLLGQYVVAVRADMGQPLVHIEVSTPSSMTQLILDEQEALKELIHDCCPGLVTPSSSSSSSSTSAAVAAAAGTASAWCSSVGRAITNELRQWYTDICHVAPNICDKDGHLRRLVIPPYALRCPRFPRSLAKFSRLQQLDLSYSTAPGSIAEVAEVVKQLHQLQHLHLRGVGLRGPLSCELVQAGRSLQSLSLSDNDKLSGSLPPCWLQSPTLEELQLAGLPGLLGPLPTLDGTISDPSSGTAGDTGSESSSGTASDTASDTSSQRGPLVTPSVPDSSIDTITKSQDIHNKRSMLYNQDATNCGFGRLKFVNMAGVIGDAEQGLTGNLPRSLHLCKDILYLDLSGHALSGPLPLLPEQLQFMNLSSNAFIGSLSDFSSSPALQYVDLSFNRLSGVIPDLTVLQALDWLDLSDNDLTGHLPTVPATIRWLDLSHNGLTGSLDLIKKGMVTSNPDVELLLVLLNLSYNKLTGTLPSTLATAPHLSFLDVSNNQLSGPLDGFAAALLPTNQLLQINLSHNMLTGQLTHQLQLLAALRPVHVTMRDGVTPVLRIFDVSHNNLQGMFPTWLLTTLPQLVDVCRCSVGISIDSSRFTCPDSVPQEVNSHRVMERLRRFEALQCVAGKGSTAQQIPIWQLAGASYRHFTRQQHKALTAPQQQQQQQQSGPSSGVIAGVVIAAVAAAALLAAVVVTLIKYRKKRRHEKAVDALLCHFDPDHQAGDNPHLHLPAFTDCLHEAYQESDNNSYNSRMITKGREPSQPPNSTAAVMHKTTRGMGALFRWYSSSSSSSSSSSGKDGNDEMSSAFAQGGHAGDGVCEIALARK